MQRERGPWGPACRWRGGQGQVRGWVRGWHCAGASPGSGWGQGAPHRPPEVGSPSQHHVGSSSSSLADDLPSLGPALSPVSEDRAWFVVWRARQGCWEEAAQHKRPTQGYFRSRELRALCPSREEARERLMGDLWAQRPGERASLAHGRAGVTTPSRPEVHVSEERGALGLTLCRLGVVSAGAAEWPEGALPARTLRWLHQARGVWM